MAVHGGASKEEKVADSVSCKYKLHDATSCSPNKCEVVKCSMLDPYGSVQDVGLYFANKNKLQFLYKMRNAAQKTSSVPQKAQW